MSKKKISLLLPTRGRPKLVERFLNSVREQSARPELVEVIICVDEDDTASHGIRFPGLHLRQLVVPRQNMGVYNTICLAASTGDITIGVNDDMIVRTPGWDDKVRELDAGFPDGVYLGYGNDLFKGRKFCTFPVLSRRLTELMAAPYPKAYRGSFIDVHLMDIFKRLEKIGQQRIAYRDDIVFEHRHYRVDPSVMDATYAERPRFGDDMTFIALTDLRRCEAEWLLDALEGRNEAAADECRPPFRIPEPNMVSIVPLCVKSFWLDTGLPLRWRTYLCTWMIARYYYSRFLHTASHQH